MKLKWFKKLVLLLAVGAIAYELFVCLFIAALLGPVYLAPLLPIPTISIMAVSYERLSKLPFFDKTHKMKVASKVRRFMVLPKKYIRKNKKKKGGDDE